MSASAPLKPRVRFAPSPTGYLHVGGVRTAIFNYLFARQHGGTFILRIDDTDTKRNLEEAVKVIIDGMKWVGLDWDEGPEKGGNFGPYYQSQRFDRYKAAAEKLEKSGRAYWAKKQIGDKLPDWKIEKMKKAGKWDEDLAKASQDPNPALYFKIHEGEPQDVTLEDAVWGRYSRPADVLNDYVLLRGDGTPTYNFATVVDDIEMGITHIIRGEDHLANTPKQINLYKALGAPLPQFAHLPMIHNDKGEKISKRRDPVAVTLYQACGLQPEALFNFLALLGWSPGDDREIMTKDEMIAAFTLERIKLAPAQFTLARKRDLKPEADEKERADWLAESLPTTKLEWMNGEYMKKLPLPELVERARPFLAAQGYALDAMPAEKLAQVVKLEQERSRTLRQLAENVKLFFAAPASYDPKAVEKVLKKGDGLAMLKDVRAMLDAQSDWAPHVLEEALKKFVEAKSTKFGNVAQPIRVALSGATVSPPIHDTLAVLGKAEALARIDRALAAVA
ncbi:MAG: glutamate--tRNA ligase [Planctomycetota bacterium]|nr:glutamate--tRNA ligase [Planctomycetota bacterium]